eukprot:487421-Prymnesium_polylepis.1
MRLRNVLTAARAASVGWSWDASLFGFAGGAAVKACSMGLILAGGVVTVFVEMEGGASLKRTRHVPSSARNAGGRCRAAGRR